MAKNIRDYDRVRMNKIAVAMWGALLRELKDDEGVCFIPSGEVLDAMALVGGMILSSWPDAKVPSKLRLRCEEHAKNLAERTRQAVNDDAGKTIFDVVLSEPAEGYH